MCDIRSSSVPRGCGFGFVSLVIIEACGALRVLALLEISLIGGFIPPWRVPGREEIFVVGTGLISAAQGRALLLLQAGGGSGFGRAQNLLSFY